ncbi:hypothetical protein Aph02nite_46460 [Actinoplanes philippinensis]|uniref:Carbohydrate binding module (Family 6) n=1 Tax=Actinoplanes philippinensis TaxID=35752 RepID=A0A1I2I2W1_9ACTN|nr:carbohydrate-binding protein [Actinoplanes philippinensis]GIE78696.1 hypothetical protein Aph02nite_46460 [Actinoplanes philippinensis]SFF36534.1 Carbohydrate binding module (family 6) [Actinoplanes philippinensis]
MEERPSASLFRPYVLTPDGTPPARSDDSPTRVLPAVAADRPVPPAATAEPGRSQPAERTPALPDGPSDVADAAPALRRSHRAWFLGTAVVLAAAILGAARMTATDRETGPADGSAAEWVVPSAPVPAEATPGSVPADSAGGDTPEQPQGGNPRSTGAGTADPGRAPRSPAAPPQNATAYTVIQAETFDEQNGVKIEKAPTGTGRHVGFITKGDWIRYDDIGFTDVPATSLQISAADWARNDGTGVVEVRLDDRAAPPIGVMTIPNNHSWFDFVTYTMTIRPTTGVHTVYLTFTSRQREEFANIDWFRFRHLARRSTTPARPPRRQRRRAPGGLHG